MVIRICQTDMEYVNPGKRGKKEWSIYTYQDEGDKCHGGICNRVISKHIP